MTRGGRQNDQDDPERKCIVSGEVQPKAGLIRFCLGPDGMVVPDILARLPGRGFYVSADRAMIDKAAAKGLFSALRARAVKDPRCAGRFGRGIAAAPCDRIDQFGAQGIGRAVMGYEKVKEWLASGKAYILIQAADGSDRGKTKLRAPEGEGRFIGLLSAQELGLAFGRERAIHAALAAGGLTKRVVEDAARLSGLRMATLGQNGGIPAEKDTKDA
ncbi:MAG: RNA-binding protein [Cypionkella sp.]|nr:RNA-binding protein [Cypionkella sp.]